MPTPPWPEPGNGQGRGSVHVFHGHPRAGLVINATGSAPNDVYLTQDSAEGAGAAEPGDAFGSATLVADLNGDGCADLAVGSPGEDLGAGRIHVFFGSATGLRTSGSQSVALSAIPGAPGSAPRQGLGASLSAGDVDGDGIDDLVAGVSGLRVSGKESAGGVAVVFGGTGGLQLQRSVLLTRDTAGVAGTTEASAGFGTAVATGDFRGNGRAEIVVGATDSGVGGSVQILRRSGTGFSGGEPIDAESPEMPGMLEWYCAFGSVLATGDVDGNGRDDLAVGDPGFGCRSGGSELGQGAVVLLYGSSYGLTTELSEMWTQSGRDVAGTEREGNMFGESLTMARLNRDRYVDLAIGAPGDSSGGSVTILLGSALHLTTDGIGGTRYTQATAGIPGTGEAGDHFGDTVSAVYAQSRGQATLVIGTPGEDVGTISDAGAFSYLTIGSSGPNPSSAKTITADTAGVQGTCGPGEQLGGSTRRWG